MSIRDLWEIMEMSNIKAVEVPKGGKKENGKETIFENVPKVIKDVKLKIQVAIQISHRIFKKLDK